LEQEKDEIKGGWEKEDETKEAEKTKKELG
jgi:hypothetical protein